MRLIDADAYLEQLARLVYGPCLDRHQILAVEECALILQKAPTVDAVEVPCKMGGVVWGIQKHIRGQQAKQGVVNQMYFGEDMRLCICVKNVCRGEWGKKVFATKEEAEAALAKMDGGGR